MRSGLLDRAGAVVDRGVLFVPRLLRVRTPRSGWMALWQEAITGRLHRRDDAGNIVDLEQARRLKTATGEVSVSGAAAPSTGQVLTATGATAATWQTPASSSLALPVSGSIAKTDLVAPLGSGGDYWCLRVRGNNTTYNAFHPLPTTSGTFAKQDAVDHTWFRYTSAASLGAKAGWTSGAFNLAEPANLPWWRARIRLGGSIAVVRHTWGWTTSDFTNADSYAAHSAFWRYSTPAGDTSLKFVTRDATTTNVNDTGLALSASDKLLVHHQFDTSTTIRWRVWNLTAGTDATGTTSTNVPATGNWMFWNAALFTNEAVGKAIDLHAVEGGLLPYA